MMKSPGMKFTCEYFHDNEWIMFDGKRFVFENGTEVPEDWWDAAFDFHTDWWEFKEESK